MATKEKINLLEVILVVTNILKLNRKGDYCALLPSF